MFIFITVALQYLPKGLVGVHPRGAGLMKLWVPPWSRDISES